MARLVPDPPISYRNRTQAAVVDLELGTIVHLSPYNDVVAWDMAGSASGTSVSLMRKVEDGEKGLTLTTLISDAECPCSATIGRTSSTC